MKRSASVFLLLLACLLLAPLAHAASGASLPDGAPLTAVGLALGCTLMGVTVYLSARNHEKERDESILLDTDNDKQEELAEKIQHYASLKAQEKLGPLEEKSEHLASELSSLKTMVVGEIVRIKKLTAPKNDEGETTLDVEKEAAYLEGLPAERLQMEYERLPEKAETLSVTATTTDAEPVPAGGDVYDDMK